MADRTTEPDDLARDRVAEQREVRGLPVARPFDQPSARTEIDAQQLTQLAAGPGGHQPGHLVLDVRRERNLATSEGSVLSSLPRCSLLTDDVAGGALGNPRSRAAPTPRQLSRDGHGTRHRAPTLGRRATRAVTCHPGPASDARRWGSAAGGGGDGAASGP